jgi:two-component system phosphate regulon sensor histidine kinase PhoR
MAAALDRAFRLGLLRLAALFVLAAGIGIAFDVVAIAIAVVASVALGHTLWRLRQMYRWIAGRSRRPPLDDHGLWSALYAALARRHRQQIARTRRLLRLVRAFRTTATALPDATVVQDAQGRILWFNRAASRLLGLNYPHDIGSHFSNLVRAPRVTEWLDAGDFGEPLLDVPAPSDDRVRLSLRMIAYEDGQRLLVARDVSKLMQLEQVRRDFVANVSHELRTPLTVVHGYLDLIEPDPNSELEPILAELRVQSRRMTQIVEDLLTLSRLVARDSLPDERVSIAPMLRTLKREADALSQGRHEVGVDAGFASDLLGSTKELHSAFSNLVTNAVRYTPSGGRITIRWTQRPSGEACFAVSDSGQGIAPHHLPRITERFYRVSTSRSRDSGGTGLGLSIVKHVLQLHQARLDITSELGVGSTFSCVFPPARVLAPIAAGADA